MKIINIFDYDGTLTTTPRPQFISFAKAFNFADSNAMFQIINEYRKTHSGDRIQILYDFYNTLLKKFPVKVEDIMIDEKYTIFNPGVKEFFKNLFTNPNILNYIISSGLLEYLRKLEIAKYFNEIYASTTEIQNMKITQITKPMTLERKIEAIKEIMKVNDKDDCQGINYIGDGITDGPSFDFVHKRKGNAILVYRDLLEGKEILRELQKKGIIIDKFFNTDFNKSSPLVRYLTQDSE